MSDTVVQMLLEKAQTGTEAEVRTFIGEHFREFPQNIQDHISVAMFVDALDENRRENEEFQDFLTALTEVLLKYVELEKEVDGK